jgi:hypothetical protein
LSGPPRVAVCDFPGKRLLTSLTLGMSVLDGGPGTPNQQPSAAHAQRLPHATSWCSTPTCGSCWCAGRLQENAMDPVGSRTAVESCPRSMGHVSDVPGRWRVKPVNTRRLAGVPAAHASGVADDRASSVAYCRHGHPTSNPRSAGLWKASAGSRWPCSAPSGWRWCRWIDSSS